MTKPVEGERSRASRPRCGWCGRTLPERHGPGRPRRWCKQGCRQAAYAARRWAAAHGLGDDDVVVSRRQLDDLLDRAYCLQAAVEDVERDLRSGRTKADLEDALGWLLENARPLADARLEPRALDHGP